MADLLHIIQGADVDDNDHVKALLQVFDELELPGQTFAPFSLPLRFCALVGSDIWSTVLRMHSVLVGVVLAIGPWRELPGRRAWARIIAHRSPQNGLRYPGGVGKTSHVSHDAVVMYVLGSVTPRTTVMFNSAAIPFPCCSLPVGRLAVVRVLSVRLRLNHSAPLTSLAWRLVEGR